VNLPFSKLNELLDKATTLFESTAYKKIWPEIDNVRPVKDEILVGRLEAQLDAEFKSGNAQKKIVMFTPTQRREEAQSVDSFVFGRLSKSPAMRPYLTVDSWTNFLKKKQRLPSVAEAKNSPIHLLNEAKDETSGAQRRPHFCTSTQRISCSVVGNRSSNSAT
jgi:uncharacterized protein (TIGR04141 family)